MDDEKHRSLLEPSTAPLAERWHILQAVKAMGIYTGVMMMPVIPFISDSKTEMERMLQKAKNADVDFILFGGMTLKAGRQKEFFMDFIQEKFPELEQKFQDLYHLNDAYGLALPAYCRQLDRSFYELARKYRIPFRIPHKVFSGVVPLYTEAALLLAHIGDYLYAQGTHRKAYQFACYAIQKWAFELKKKIGRKKSFHYSLIEDEFRHQVESGGIKKISGIGDAIHNMLGQFLETGKIPYYERVRKDFSN
jgi:hypothetical protein